VRHSASPAMQNAGFEALGLNWRYMAFEVVPAHLGAAIDGARRMGFMGLNLTVPHKIAALSLVDALDPAARDWGAINTIVFQGYDGSNWKPLHAFPTQPEEVRSFGCNTDVEAIAQAVKEDLKVEIKGSRVLLLGAGGAGRSAALKLAADGASELFLVNRTESKAEELVAELQGACPKVKVFAGYPPHDVDLVINATSLGLKSNDPLPIDTEQFPLERAACAFDMVYRPATTRFLALAKQAGSRTANGLSMLLYQGAAAMELWTGKPAPTQIMRTALEKEIYA
jgi:shikimate dehydrogenase